jgi:peptidoglycan/LPS O-acetylase OafA/YrhL
VIAYRKDIDGLRAVAILPVILHHLREESGGYVGVDVFFVISGYLITTIIFRETQAGTFSLVEFYRRRIQRIVPALVAVIFASLIAGLLILPPPEYAQLGLSATAAALSFSNILFWSQTGYFEAGSALKPLLHTWSLGVEEQFYIVFPVLLITIRNWPPRRIKATIWGLCAASLALSAWQVFTDRVEDAFFLLPGRFWELGVGSLLAIGALSELPRRSREIAALAGLGMIAACVAIMDTRTPFPGLAAMPACIGAALIIMAGRGEGRAPLVNQALSLWPVVLIGQISYSLYLWHWPIIVFARLGLPEFGLVAQATAVMAMFVAAWLSWRFVERPFRVMPQVATAKVLTVGGGSLAVLAAGGLALLLNRGLDYRLTPDQRQLVAALSYDTVKGYDAGHCYLERRDRLEKYDGNACLGGPERILLLGDSHAAHLRSGLVGVLGPIKQVTASGCKPLLHRYNAGAQTCGAILGRVFASTFTMKPGGVIVVAARWSAADVADIRSTAIALREKADRVVIVGPVPQYSQAVPRLLLKASQTADPALVEAHRERQHEAIDRALSDQLRGLNGIVYVSALDHFCTPDGCRALAADGAPLAWDYGHFTDEGSASLAQGLAPVVLGPISTAEPAE